MVTVHVRYDQQGNIVGYEGINMNQSQRKRMEEELRTHRDRLEEMVQTRTAKLESVNAQLEQELVERKQIEQALQKVAAKLGANAVVIVADHSQMVGAMLTGPPWARSVNTISGRVIVGVAIRYTQP